MALRQTARFGRLHFGMRAAGLTGLLILGVGLVILREVPEEEIGTYLAVGGGGLLGLALLFESGGLIRLIASRRAALGSNVVLQIALAVLLLVGVNMFSFFHHLRLDLTRDQIFTIDPQIQQQLAGLRGETRIVLFQRHDQGAVKPDNYDAAAERKIVEKVKDLVEQFQELGPRFRVEVLDIQDEDYQDKLGGLKKQSPALALAIENAPENSIFFYSTGAGGEETGKVQRLSFHDVYQLDKKASQEADNGRGNLVLRYQGVEPFARRVLNIDEKKPRIAVAVVHEVLGLDDPLDLGMSAAKKTLTAHGFDSRSIILKKGFEAGMPEPVVLTSDESKYEQLDDAIAESRQNVEDLEKELKVFRQWLHEWQTLPVAELSKSELAKRIEGADKVDEEIRQQVVQRFLQPNVAVREMALKQENQDRTAAEREQAGLNVENLSEQRRISDLRAKFDRMLADVDLLIVPRMTLLNVAQDRAIPNWVHGLDPAQLDAIKDFMKAGKPVLFCLGPTNEAPNRPPPPFAGADRLEDTLSELGLKMPRQTILFNVESKSFAERRSGFLVLGAETQVPPLEFAWKVGELKPLASTIKREPNPVRVSLRLAARSFGSTQDFDLRLRNPRPIYYEPEKAGKGPDAVFLLTSPEAWNEPQPFPSPKRTPRFEPPKPNDPDRGTVSEERRGQFPVGVAVQTHLPSSWYDGKETNRPPVRLAVIGHGGVFSGPAITPAKEKLLLDVSNWLLGRDDLLAHEDPQPWRYPRVILSDPEMALWKWGTVLGLPLLFVYLGLMVLMVRRMRYRCRWRLRARRA